jgi:hypothetical protein
MSLLLLIPGFISFFLVLRGRIESAFLSVYLPCLLCLPDEYRVRIPHLPPTSTAQSALIPLGIVGLYRLIRSGSFALMDLLVLLYTASVSLSEILHGATLNDGIFSAVDAFISILLAYAAGRRLIEPDLRVATVRRFVTLVLLDGPCGLWEWRMGQSPYGIFATRVLGLGTLPEGPHLRNGRGRMGTALGGGELAGIALAMTFCLNAWLAYLRRVKASVDLGKILTRLEKYHVPGLLLLSYAFMTQSRGPLIALGGGYLILQIPRFKYTRVMTLLVAVLLIGGYMAMSAHFASYADVPAGSGLDEQQSSVLYRKEMNELYPPVAEKGGWTGYGVLGIPNVQRMKSIDNQYLLVHLAWGRLGYYLFILIVWENTRVLLVRSWQLESLQDRAFIFSMLAAMAVLWFTLLTVFLGGQLPQIAFLLIGWIQSTGRPEIRGFSFRRVFS